GQVLVHHRLEQAGDDLLHGHARLHERVGVGLGEDAALAADLVEAHALVGHVGQALARHRELARGLLDEGAGASAAGGLHVHLLGLPPAARRGGDRLHALAADLGHEADVGVLALHAGGHRDDLLHHLGAHEGAEEPRAGAGEEDAVAAGHELRLVLHASQELQHLLGLARVMALVVLPQDPTRPPSLRSGPISVFARLAFDEEGLHGRGADVHADVLHAAALRVPALAATWSTRLAAVPA